MTSRGAVYEVTPARLVGVWNRIADVVLGDLGITRRLAIYPYLILGYFLAPPMEPLRPGLGT